MTMNPSGLIKHLQNQVEIEGTPSNNVHSVVVSFVDSRGAITNIVSKEYEEASMNENDTILENCDETVFRPVVTVFSSSEVEDCSEHVSIKMNENFVQTIQPELIVPVIDEKMLLETSRKRENITKIDDKVTKDFEIEKVVSKKSKKTRKSSNKSINIEASKMTVVEKVPEPPTIIAKEEKQEEEPEILVENENVTEVEMKPQIEEIEVINDEIEETPVESFDVIAPIEVNEMTADDEMIVVEEVESKIETPPEEISVEVVTSKKSKRNRRNKKSPNNCNNEISEQESNQVVVETPATTFDDVIDSPVELIDGKQFEMIETETDELKQDLYDLDDELALAPLSSFDEHFSEEPRILDEKNDENRQLKSKISEVVKNTNMIFAMCSSLKDVIDGSECDEDVKSTSSLSQIQRSTSSSVTTNTTTSTFASAHSIQTGEGIESDYKSFEIDAELLDEMKVVECEDISSENATSSETDDNSLRPTKQTEFKAEDDEELRPLLQTSVNSLPSPLENENQNSEIIDENCDFPPLDDPNPKSAVVNNSSNNGRNRRNKKKRR